MLEYNTKGGKMNRGLGVVDVMRAFAASENRELRHEEVGKGVALRARVCARDFGRGGARVLRFHCRESGGKG